MNMPFVEIQRINLDLVSLNIPYWFYKLAAFKKKTTQTLMLSSFSLIHIKLMLGQIELAWHLSQFQFH